MTEKKKIAWEMPKREVVEQQEYVADTKLYGDVRHENSIVNYVSNDLAEKGKLAVVLMSLFMDNKYVSPYTGKKTYMDIEESYICSGVYDEKELDKVYDAKEVEVEVYDKQGNTRIEYEIKYEVLDKQRDRLIRAEGISYFNKNGLGSFFHSMLIEKMGGIPIADLVKTGIYNSALFAEDSKERDRNRRMAIDVLGLKVKKQETTINLRKHGGGEVIEAIASTDGAGFLGGSINLDEDDGD